MKKALVLLFALSMVFVCIGSSAQSFIFFNEEIPFGSSISDVKFALDDVTNTDDINVYLHGVPSFAFPIAYLVFSDDDKLIGVGSVHLWTDKKRAYDDAKERLTEAHGEPMQDKQADIISLVNPTEFMLYGVNESEYDGVDCLSWETDTAQVVLYKDINGDPKFNDPNVYVLYTPKDIADYFK